MVDPRVSIIGERLKDVRSIIAVSSGKGGVGKSLIASVLALTLAKKGYKVGLFDLDFTSPSSHIILGTSDLHPEEEKGIFPPEIHGIKYMSIIYYSGELASPLRGTDVSNALIELLVVTRWDGLDFLVLDMPPGISDVTLDIIRFVKKTNFLIVTTPSQLAFETIRKLINLLRELKISVVGVVENMKMKESQSIQQQVEGIGVKFWGTIPFDPKIEEAIGDVTALSKTEAGKKIWEIAANNLIS